MATTTAASTVQANQGGNQAPIQAQPGGGAGGGGGGGPPGGGGAGGGGGGGGPPGGGAAGGGQGGNQQGNPQPAVTFALTPGDSFNGVINFGTKDGREFYKMAIAALEEDSPYDCEPDGLHRFVKSLEERATEFNWTKANGTMMIHVPASGQHINLVTHYGMVTMQEVKEYELTYVFNDVREAQDSFLLYQCLMNSLSIEGKDKVRLYKAEYTLENPNPGRATHLSGSLLFKLIVREAFIDTHATENSIRVDMSNLYLYAENVGGDVDKLNARCTTLEDQLAARGKQSTDLLLHLFKAYKTIQDNEFNRYIKDKEAKYEEGDNMTPAKLKHFALSKYRILVSKNEWKAKTAEQNAIIALQAEQGKKSKQKAKPKGNPKKEKKKSKLDRPEWLEKNIKPGPNDPKVRVWKTEHNEHKYWWCGKETGGTCKGVWRRHSPADCKPVSELVRKKNKNKDSTDDDEANQKKKAKIIEAASVLLERDN